MAVIISLETSTDVCSVALHENQKLIAVAEVHREQSHASKLALLLDHVMKQADIDKSALDAVAVSSGPGSYTGLRIGTSTAKGLAYALSIPLLSIGTLELMATQVQAVMTQPTLLCPMLDARRMEVYCLLWSKGEITRPVQALIVEDGAFAAELEQGPIVFFGNGADKCRDVIRHPNAIFLSGIVPSASALGPLAWRKLEAGELENISTFEPHYLKEFMIKKPAAAAANESGGK